MAYEQKDNSGTLFKNDRRDSENHPHAKGKALIGGVWYWVSAWTKEPKGGGDRFQSLSFQEMTPEQSAKYGGAGGGAQAPRQQQRSQGGPAPRPQRQPVGAPFVDEQQIDPNDVPF